MINGFLDILNRSLFGGYGGLKKSDVKKELRRSKFSEFLPYIAYDDETCVYTLNEDSDGFLWECSPHVFSSPETFSIIHSIYQTAFPKNTVIQYILYADPTIDPILSNYQKMNKEGEPLIAEAKRRISEFLKRGTLGIEKMQDIPIRNFRLFFAVKFVRKEVKKERFDLKRCYTAIEEILSSAKLSPRPFNPSKLLDLLRRILNPAWDEGQSSFCYDDEIPIKKQIIQADTVIQKEHKEIQISSDHQTRYLRCITPKLPAKNLDTIKMNELFGGYMGTSDDATQYISPFLFCVNVVVQNLSGYLNTNNWIVKTQRSVGAGAKLLNKKKAEFSKAVSDLNEKKPYVRMIPTLWMWDNDSYKLEICVQRAIGRWNKAGFTMQRDAGILQILLISSLPFGLFTEGKNIENLDRDFIVPTQTAASIFPSQIDFKGNESPCMLLVGRKGQLVSIDQFTKYTNNMNGFVIATSGAGKSFLVNYIIFNNRAKGAKIRIIDIGGSYKKMTAMLGARFLDFGPDTNIITNPFATIIDDESDVNNEINISKGVNIVAAQIGLMIFPNQGGVDETQYSILKECVRHVYQEYNGLSEPNHVYDTLNDYEKLFFGETQKLEGFHFEIIKQAKMLAYNFRDWVKDGAYAKYVNGISNFNIKDDDFVILELEHLKPIKELFTAITSIVIQAVTHDLYLGDRSRPVYIACDEAWQFAGEGDLIKQVLIEGYRRARKYNGSFNIITQSATDLEKFGEVGEVIQENSSFKFYLESNSFEKARKKNIIDLNDFMFGLLKTVKSVTPRYTEIFVDIDGNCGIARLIVDDYTYYIYTSDAAETAEIERIIKEQGVNYHEAIEQMVLKYRS
ncbi:MAG: TraC family protein [Deltaproteobacteria bacterium]|nr:TraC family protein [Deltaproteobacteria bacterium]MBT4525321.1 TraC family protein [Deltaproteobacteria bacterium]